MTAEFVENPWSLSALLQAADTEDLDILVDYLTDQGGGRLALSGTNCKRLLLCKREGVYGETDRNLIANEIRLFGGNTIINALRGNEGVSYTEVLEDVANHLKANFDRYDGIATVETAILRRLLVNSFDKMTGDEQVEAVKSLGFVDQSGLNPAALNANLLNASLSAAGTYNLAAIVANAVSQSVLGRGLTIAAGATLARTMGVLLGPISWVLTGVWTIVDLASPALRVTVPCVVQIAYIRQKALQRVKPSVCTSCETAPATGAKFCSECGSAVTPEELPFIAGRASPAEKKPQHKPPPKLEFTVPKVPKIKGI
ncbi:YaaW family protein [Paraburkholderia graminis]